MIVRLGGLLGRREGAKSGWGRWFEWSVFLYCFLSLGFFMVLYPIALSNKQLRSLKYVILSDAGSTVDVGVGNNRGQTRRIQFLSGISIVQLVFMWLLTGNA